MTQEGESTLQEVFSMTSLADSVKLLPWCISSDIPLHHLDDALVATKRQGKTIQAITAMPKHRALEQSSLSN